MIQTHPKANSMKKILFFDKIKKRLDEIEQKLVEPTDISKLNPSERETIRMMLEIMNKLYG